MESMPEVDLKPGIHANDTGSPDLTVVVTSTWDPSYLKSCLESLRSQTSPAEVIVAGSGSEGLPETLCREYPELTFLNCPPSTPPPGIRCLAMRAARGRVVALTKAVGRVPRDWCSNIIRLHQENDQVIGGAIEFASLDNGPNWAAFLCEYSHLLPGAIRGVDLASSNISYKRRLLEQNWDLFGSGEWETLIHWKLQRRGVRFLPVPELVVSYHQQFQFCEFLRQRYYFARSFAEMRSRQTGWWRRILRAAGSPLLPLLFFSRISRNVISRPGYRWALARSLPFLIPCLLIGAAAELCGYLHDSDCSDKVR